MSEMPTRARASLATLVTLVMVCAVAPASMNIVMPALPAIQTDFGVPTSTAQLLVSLSILCVAVATLAYGPLSDRYGRRPVLLSGLALFLVGSVICAVAPTITVLIAGRIVQAVGGAAGLVLTRAMVRDLFDRESTARVLAYLTMAMVIAPMLAPFVGGALTDMVSWRAIFVFTTVAGVVVFLAVLFRLPETRAKTADSAGAVPMLRGFAALLRSPAFCGYAIQSAVLMAMFYVFTATTPYLMVYVFQRPATEYGLYFMLLSVGYIIGSFTSTRLTPRIGIDRVILIGSVLCVLGGTGVFALAIAGIWGPLALFLPLGALDHGQRPGATEHPGGRGQRQSGPGRLGLGLFDLRADGHGGAVDPDRRHLRARFAGAARRHLDGHVDDRPRRLRQRASFPTSAPRQIARLTGRHDPCRELSHE